VRATSKAASLLNNFAYPDLKNIFLLQTWVSGRVQALAPKVIG
jgi:hypothetical protein